jgi:WD40 repeat protein
MAARYSFGFMLFRLSLMLAVPFLAIGHVTAQAKQKIEVIGQIGHGSHVSSVAFSPDGRFVLSGSLDMTLKLWDVATGKLVRTFVGGQGSNSVAFSPDGRTILSGDWDNTLKLWNVATGELLRIIEGHSGGVRSVAFSPDGRTVLSGSFDQTVKHWDGYTGKLLRTFQAHTLFVTSVAFSSDGLTVLSGSGDNSVKLWDLTTGKLLRTFQGRQLADVTQSVQSVTFSPDGRTVLSGSGDKTLKLWDVATGRVLRTFLGHSHSVDAVAFSPDGRTALSGSHDATLKSWDVTTGKLLRTFQGSPTSLNDFVKSVAFSPDGRTVISGNEDKTLKLWDAATGELLRTFEGHSNSVRAVAFSPDGRTVLSGSEVPDPMLRLWDAATGKLLRTFERLSQDVISVAFAPDGRTVVSGGFEQPIKHWDVVTGKLLRTFPGHPHFVNAVTFSPDGRQILSGGWDKSLKLWDVTTGKLLRTFLGHAHWVTAVAFSPDGRTVISGSEDKTLKLWDVVTGGLQSTIEGHSYSVQTVAFSPDGRSVLSGSYDTTLKLWDVATSQLLHTFEGHSNGITSAAFSPDGRSVLSGSSDNSIKLWDVAKGKLLRNLDGHFNIVWSVAFAPDGRTALSGSRDGSFRFWSSSSGSELMRVLANPKDGWLAIIPDGFFDFSGNTSDQLHVVRGMEVTIIDQVKQSLFNPDLTRQALAHDPNGEVRRAADFTNLEKVIDSGPAPEVAIMSQLLANTTASDLATVTARIIDRGKGIGRIEWRINGITVSVAAKPAGSGPEYMITQQLALDLGDNLIEVVAYNASNILASLPARTTIKLTSPANIVKPKLHVLAIGINAYSDKGWTPPDSSDTLRFPPLKLAVNDAVTFAAALEKAGAGQYSEVRVTRAIDSDATVPNLEKIVARISSEISPRDTFVLFAAAHGYSVNGRFYLVLQDHQGGPDPAALERYAIDQNRLQDWLANGIKAKKAVILLDTCESGALVGGYTKSRIDQPTSEAALGRLHEATGRPVLTAAAEGQPAFEGFGGHGVFTWALLDALKNGDRNNNGTIELSELAAHVQDQVPKLSLMLNGTGRAVIAARGMSDDQQSARFGSRGEDFTLVRRLH